MQMQTQHRPAFNRQHVERVLFSAAAPEIVIYPFKRSSTTRLRYMAFTVALASIENQLNVVDKLLLIVRRINGALVSTSELRAFLNRTNAGVLQFIVEAVTAAYAEWQTYFQSELAAYVETSFSKFQWEIAQSIGIETLMRPPLSAEQRMWIAFASVTHKNAEKQFFLDIVENLKPWFNIDLFRDYEKMKKTKKTNVAYDTARVQMLDGSFGLPSADRQIIDDLEAAQQQQHKRTPVEDLDIVR